MTLYNHVVMYNAEDKDAPWHIVKVKVTARFDGSKAVENYQSVGKYCSANYAHMICAGLNGVD